MHHDVIGFLKYKFVLTLFQNLIKDSTYFI